VTDRAQIAALAADAVREGFLRHDVPLAGFTSFRIGGTALNFFSPANIDEAARLVASLNGEPCRILGGGTNLLVASEIIEKPVIILPAASSWEPAGKDGEMVLIRVPAGMPTALLVRMCAGEGLSGTEMLAGVPGTVGGAVAMNAGGRYGRIGERVRSVEFIDRGGEKRLMNREKIPPGCWRANPGDVFIVYVTLWLETRESRDVAARTREVLAEKKKAQPLGEKSAGCVFKNPGGFSAGKLIDEAGLAGTSCGDAVVSGRHANFIVNRGRASAADVLDLIDIVRERVATKFGLTLELEIQIW